MQDQSYCIVPVPGNRTKGLPQYLPREARNHPLPSLDHLRCTRTPWSRLSQETPDGFFRITVWRCVWETHTQCVFSFSQSIPTASANMRLRLSQNQADPSGPRSYLATHGTESSESTPTRGQPLQAECQAPTNATTSRAPPSSGLPQENTFNRYVTNFLEGL